MTVHRQATDATLLQDLDSLVVRLHQKKNPRSLRSARRQNRRGLVPTQFCRRAVEHPLLSPRGSSTASPPVAQTVAISGRPIAARQLHTSRTLRPLPDFPVLQPLRELFEGIPTH